MNGECSWTQRVLQAEMSADVVAHLGACAACQSTVRLAESLRNWRAGVTHVPLSGRILWLLADERMRMRRRARLETIMTSMIVLLIGGLMAVVAARLLRHTIPSTSEVVVGAALVAWIAADWLTSEDALSSD